MANRLKVMVLYGGKSGEHEISLLSSAYVLASLDPQKYDIIPVAMDKDGLFYQHQYDDLKHYKDKLPVVTPQAKLLPSLLKDGRIEPQVDVVFPVVHGPLYEDGSLQGLLELAGVAYVGCDVVPSALGMDKDIGRRLVEMAGIAKCARYKRLSWHSSASERQQFCQDVAADLGWPVIVKPCSLGSSVGTHKASNLSELAAAVEDALRYDEEILVEEFLHGQEIELSVLENRNPSARPRVSVAGEIRVHHRDGFYSYAAKYLESDKTELLIPAQLPESTVEKLKDVAANIFTALKCKGLARVDFFVNQQTGAIYFNEVNTLPGFTAISMYPKLWEKSGIAGGELMDELVALALIHHGCRQKLVTNYL